MAPYTIQASNDNFFRARNSALVNDLQHILNPEETKLLSFNDIKKMLKPQNEVYLGMKTVPIKLIVGSEGRYMDFDNKFFPKRTHLRSRWARIDQAYQKDIILPPISLYEIGGLYFVRDGNHRVSVAKTKGLEFIDAEVVSLQSEIKLKPSSSIKNILKQVLRYEKRVFYAETHFGDITDCWTIDFSTTGQYDVLYQHILIHKYYMNEDLPEEIPLHEAIFSWYEEIYLPVVESIKKQKLLRSFPKRTISDMYVWVIRYWDELKQQFGNEVSIEDATTDFGKTYKKSIFQQILEKFTQLKP